MNQRMIDLYKEACEFAYKVCREEGRTGGASDHIWNTLSTGRFAELIVRECASVAGKYIHENKYTENGVSDFWLKETIKEHFGVEE